MIASDGTSPPPVSFRGIPVVTRLSAEQASINVALQQLTKQWREENALMLNSSPHTVVLTSTPEPLSGDNDSGERHAQGNTDDGDVDDGDIDDEIRSTAPTQVLLHSQAQPRQPAHSDNCDSHGDSYNGDDSKYLSQPESVLQHSPPVHGADRAHDEFVPRSHSGINGSQGDPAVVAERRAARVEDEDGYMETDRLEAEAQRARHGQQDDAEEEKEEDDGENAATDNDSDGNSSVQLIEPAQRPAQLRSTVQHVRGESAMQHAARELANTTSDMTSMDLHRIRCQWFALSCTIRYTQQENFNDNQDHIDFFTVQTDGQRAECDNHGIAAYGDLCERHSRVLLGVYVDRSLEQCGGMGLFTSWARQKDDIICEYKGAIRRHVDRNDQGEQAKELRRNSKYAIDLPEPLTAEAVLGCSASGNESSRARTAATAHPFVLDASRTTDGFARYINDSSLGLGSPKSSGTNCELTKGLELGQHVWQLFITATRPIAAGDELSVWYGKPYWMDLRGSATAVHTALCPPPSAADLSSTVRANDRLLCCVLCSAWSSGSAPRTRWLAPLAAGPPTREGRRGRRATAGRSRARSMHPRCESAYLV